VAWHPLGFSIAPFVLKQNQQGTNFAAIASWVPGARFLDFVDVHASVGIVPLNLGVGDVFAAFETQLMVGLPGLGVLYPEVGAGGQFWGSHGGSAGMVSANLVYGVSEKLSDAFFLKTLAVGYSHVFLNYRAHFAKLTVGFDIDVL
jgi:hypothetical protein